MTTTTPRIYVASLSDYNAGRLHGRWIDANQDADAIQEEIDAMLKQSKEEPAEEWAIHDYEGFGEIKLSEFEPIEKVAEIAAALEEHDGAFEVAYSNFGNVDEALSAVKDDYLGAWDSLADWAENFLEDTGALREIPENLRSYFNFEAYARDCRLGGDVWEGRDSSGQLHVFRNS